MRRVLLTAALLVLAACTQQEASKGADPATPAAAPAANSAAAPAAVPGESFDQRLAKVILGEHRGANAARDEFRHPLETLRFFGIAAGHTVIEITPGAGWYTEILAPLMQGQGQYVAALIDPYRVGSERAKDYYSKANQAFRDKLAAAPELYGEAKIVEFDLQAPVFGEPGSADLVLTFRNVHNWVGQNATEAMFKGFFEVLKPGGVLGVVEHRAKPDDRRPLEEIARSGYLPEALVIEMATKAGFELAEKSEINANPADTKDHPNGVWTLRPTLNLEGVPESEHERIQAIGESDRMTLKFVKPAA
jgi:predicted methyltransferase